MVVEIVYTGFCNAQPQTNLVRLILIPGKQIYFIDSAYTIDKGSLKVSKSNGEIVLKQYEFYPQSGRIIFDSLLKDTLIITYRTMPLVFTKPFIKVGKHY